MAFQADTGEFNASRRDYFAVDPRGLIVNWKRNISRGGQEPPVDEDLIALARDMMPRKGPGDSEDGSSGQLNPILVRALPDRRLEVVGGFRRTRAALYLIESGECPDFVLQYKVVKMNDAEAALANLGENLQRADLTPIQTAHAVRALHEDYGMSLDAIAKRMKRGRSWLAMLTDLTTLPSDMQAAVANGALPASAALDLTKLPAPEQREVFESAKTSNGKVSAKAIKAGRRQVQEEKGAGAVVKRTLKDVRDFIEGLTGPAEPAAARKLAFAFLEFIDGKRSEKAMAGCWNKTFLLQRIEE